MPILRLDDTGEITVNFPAGLLALMREAKCLDKVIDRGGSGCGDGEMVAFCSVCWCIAMLSCGANLFRGAGQMGFSVGQTVLNIALREHQYIMLHQSLKHMIANYRRTLDELDPSLRELCGSKVAGLRCLVVLSVLACHFTASLS